ncbi:MAG TPA: tRNA (guanosine(37)-N1)-methyltransferase TrmD [Candidatus Aphodousia faecigallinarum]|uniref:tRNA (guanine-N(1)-)-methyltransferase n=1 Tax=Candidatus Aphodousia faecigallinarum TaxID=2840677 RepID=A0A9D1IHP6_9BURK|nr:tRNA (guanosine(37)-N1)-methyltransferase TrmD [Candidatus Aphodousia faecigallinarum]
MRFDVITLFEPMFAAITENGITSRAMRRGLWSLQTWNPREETEDNHRTVDDRPFGGGPGMVMLAEPLARTLKRIRRSGNKGRVISFAPNGKKLDDQTVRRWVADQNDLVLICGRYEGIDQRFLDHYVDETVSIGDFVLSGGELAAMVLIDAVVRQLPGAIKELSTLDESFSTGLLDAPHYTRPEIWEGEAVPEVLLTGHHANIAKWTRERALEITLRTRPDLIEKARIEGKLSKSDTDWLKTLRD